MQELLEWRTLARRVKVWIVATDQLRSERKLTRSLAKSRNRTDLVRTWRALALHALESKTVVAAAAIFDRRGRLSIMWLRWFLWRGIACQLTTASRAVRIMVNARLTRKFLEFVGPAVAVQGCCTIM